MEPREEEIRAMQAARAVVRAELDVAAAKQILTTAVERHRKACAASAAASADIPDEAVRRVYILARIAELGSFDSAPYRLLTHWCYTLDQLKRSGMVTIDDAGIVRLAENVDEEAF